MFCPRVRNYFEHLSVNPALDKLAEHNNSPRVKSDALELCKPSLSYINGIT